MRELIEKLTSAGWIAGVLRGHRPPVSELEQRTALFREILRANNAALGIMARIQEALQGEMSLSASEVRRLVAGVTVQTYRMVVNLSQLTGKRHRHLAPRFDHLRASISSKVEVGRVLHPVGPVLPLTEVGVQLTEAVGQKSAYLGEARRILGAHVPDGIATTVEAYHGFTRAGGLDRRIAEVLEEADLTDTASVFAACARITSLIEAAPVPVAIGQALQAAVAGIPRAPSHVAVRSSALQEGGLELSFAGQYRSMLNVPRERVVEAFKRVVASKYSPEAVTYRLGRGFADLEIGMCCCILGMVDARVAGVLYTACPSPEGRLTLIQAVRGLGISAVDGSAEPDSYLLDPTACRVVRQTSGAQAMMVRRLTGEGTEKIPILAGTSAAVLNREQAVSVAKLAWQIETALGTPLDMEWAIDQEGHVWVLQVRPQPEHAGVSAGPRRGRLDGVPVLVEGGCRASGGAGCGLIARVKTDLDILRCPPGAVIVVREANPRFAVLLPKAAAIVADMGETTGHLATVARELRVPALLATRTASARLAAGALVTVDADALVVYAGRVESLCAQRSETLPRGRDANRELLASVSEDILPLTFIDRLASGFTPKRCRTLHDIIRFCHQATIEAMFELGDAAVSKRSQEVYRLASEVPIDCRVIDLGGGIRTGVTGRDITIGDITCAPMRSLWTGMTDPRLTWTTVRAMSFRGFMSSVASFGFDEDARVRHLGEPSYVFVGSEYVSLNSRIGYHFSTVDAKVGELKESNYLSFRFVGGSTSVEQRSRRAALIERLLRRHGFETDCRLDLVNARVRFLDPSEMHNRLRLLGLLMEFVNHLDMTLISDAVASEYERAFINGDYGYRRGDHA